MQAGWFALGGVIIGGLLNGFVSWLLGQNTLRANARVAALLVTEELMQSMPPLLALPKEQVWGTLKLTHGFGQRNAWQQNRATLGHALHPDAYMTLAAAYSGLAGAADRAAKKAENEPISDADGMSMATTYLTMNRGLSHLSLLLHQPSKPRVFSRRKFRQKTQLHIDGLLEKDARYQDFMAKHGR